MLRATLAARCPARFRATIHFPPPSCPTWNPAWQLMVSNTLFCLASLGQPGFWWKLTLSWLNLGQGLSLTLDVTQLIQCQTSRHQDEQALFLRSSAYRNKISTTLSLWFNTHRLCPSYYHLKRMFKTFDLLLSGPLQLYTSLTRVLRSYYSDEGTTNLMKIFFHQFCLAKTKLKFKNYSSDCSLLVRLMFDHHFILLIFFFAHLLQISTVCLGTFSTWFIWHVDRHEMNHWRESEPPQIYAFPCKQLYLVI